MRVVFIGQNGSFTRGHLEPVAKRFDVVGIVENAPRDVSPEDGNGAKPTYLNRFASRRRLPHFLLTYRGRDVDLFLSELKPDIVCIASMSQLLSKAALQVPRLGTINVHPSKLPLYRGPNPFFWQYHQMDLKGAVSVHFVDETEDTGPILLQHPMPISLGTPFDVLLDQAIAIWGPLLVEALKKIESGDGSPWPQGHLPCPLRARWADFNEPLIDWSTWPIERVWHFMRGTSHCYNAVPPPGPGARWRIGDMLPTTGGNETGIGEVKRDPDGFFVAHREGTIRLYPPRRGTLIGRLLRGFTR